MSDPSHGSASHAQSTPFVEIDRSDWARLAPTAESPLTDAEVFQLRGLGDRLDLNEVAEVYLPLSRLLSLLTYLVLINQVRNSIMHRVMPAQLVTAPGVA